MSHYFTREEANALLVIIRPLVKEIVEISARIAADQPELLAVMEKARHNGGSREGSQAAIGFERLEALADQVEKTGAQLKDLRTGLVDFLSRRQGREVFLCWRYGEPEVRYWHDLEAGFAGRQLI
jgi:hypothetical protein